MKGSIRCSLPFLLAAACLGCPGDSGPYSLAVYLTGSGSVALDPPGGVYESGASVTLTATPDDDWHFDHWEGGATGSANPLTLSVGGNTSITAVFAADTPVYELDVDVFGVGSVTLDPAGGAYAAGTSVTLTAEAGSSWEFSHWLGGLTGSENPAAIVVAADTDITAVFTNSNGLAMQLGYGQLTRMAATPDGQAIVTGSADGVIRIWDTDTGKVEHSIFENSISSVVAVAFSPDGSEFLTSHLVGGAELWSLSDFVPSPEKYSLILRRRYDTALGGRIVRSAAFSPAGVEGLFGCDDGSVLVVDLEEGDLVATYAPHTGGVAAVAYSSDATRLATGSYDNIARVYAAAIPLPIRGFAHPGDVYAVAFTPDGENILTGCEDGGVRLCNVASGAMTLLAGGHADSVLSISTSPDGTKALSGSMDKTAILWDTVTCSPIYTLTGHDFALPSVCFARGGDELFTADRETVTQWDAASGTEITTLTGHTRTVNSAEFSPDGTMAVTAGDYTARLYDTADGSLLQSFPGHTDTVKSVSFSADGTRIATGSFDGTVRIWDAATGGLVRMIDAGAPVHAVDLSTDGTQVVAGLRSNVAQIWDVDTGAAGVTFTGHTERVSAVEFSYDGAFVATGSHDDTVKLWNAASGAEIWTYSRFGNNITAVAFSSNASELLASSFGGAFHAIDTVTGTQLWPMPPTPYLACYDVDYSPDDSLVLTGHTFEGHLWNISEVSKLQDFYHFGQVLTVDYASDGLRVLTGGEDGSTRIWQVE